MTWREMIKIQPLLNELLKEAKSYKSKVAIGGNFCANAIWYGYENPARGLKGRMLKLVGWNASDRRHLTTQEAYDVAYQKIYNALPDCQHDGWC